MVTIQEVAKYANVSVGSVSRYLNGYRLRPDNAKRIEEAIRVLDYRENMIAKALKSNQTLSVGVLVDNLLSHFSSAVVAAMGDFFEKQGYSMLLSSYRDDPKQVRRKVEFLTDRGIDGLIVATMEEDWEETQVLRELAIPVVSLVTPITFESIDSLLFDDAECTRKVVAAMIAGGHRRIGIISAPQTDFVARQRLAGAKAAFEEAGLELTDEWVYVNDYSRESGYAGMRQFIRQHATAVFVCNQNTSLGAIQQIQEQGLIVGQDMSFSAFDYLGIGEIFYPKLTMVRQPVGELGQLAAKTILEKIRHKQPYSGKTIELANEILWRDSIQDIT